MLRRLVFLLATAALLSGIGMYGVKRAFIHIADTKANEILTKARAENQLATANNAARILYDGFGKDGYKNQQTLARFRPYLSNRHLPAVFRIPHGAIELTMMEGWCDDAARGLIYILAKEGIPARQWNMQGPHSAHSAVILDLSDGKTALIDPFYGYTSIVDGKPHDALTIKNVMGDDADMKGMLKPFDKKSNHKFYEEFGTMAMGVQGDPLIITAKIPLTDTRMELGKIDGNHLDARAAVMRHDMTMTWEYAGHKYDRGWTRELLAQQPLQLDIILTKTPDDGVIRTFSPAPAIDGTRLSWNLSKGGKIISQDGKAGISPTRLNSYIEIDQIVITPEGATP